MTRPGLTPRALQLDQGKPLRLNLPGANVARDKAAGWRKAPVTRARR